MISEEQNISIVENYIQSYNRFDVEGMLKDLDPELVFKNISNGEIDLSTRGIPEFKIQAEKAKEIFSQREQKITDRIVEGNMVEVGIDYEGILNSDLSNGLKKGTTIKLKGKSIFKFRNDKIIEIRDIT